jgi:acyl dehydratase
MLLMLGVILAVDLEAAQHAGSSLTPFRKTTAQGAYTIDTVGDTLGQASPQNTRLIIRIFGADRKVVKPAQIALVVKSGAVIKPVFREDRKVGHEENTGLPLSVSPQGGTSGYSGTGVGVNLNKILGPHGDYAYTKVDWPKPVFTADKRLQIVLPGGQSFVLPLTSLAK